MQQGHRHPVYTSGLTATILTILNKWIGGIFKVWDAIKGIRHRWTKINSRGDAWNGAKLISTVRLIFCSVKLEVSAALWRMWVTCLFRAKCSNNTSESPTFMGSRYKRSATEKIKLVFSRRQRTPYILFRLKLFSDGLLMFSIRRNASKFIEFQKSVEFHTK